MSRRRSRYNDYSPWPVYVPVAERKAKAERHVAKLRKKGETIQPVEIEGRTIARSFWGKGWCDHLESFGDYSNRLPRGRSYVRNGSVCHLAIAQGKIEALVAGSSLYRVKVDVTRLAEQKWAAIKKSCTGRIGSLIELLQGKLSDEIMGVVTDRREGLFPAPGEIKYTCNCPDWAAMCKHISAVMYGIGARLDERPELLFVLRGVEHQELIGADAAASVLAGRGSRRVRRRVLSDTDVTKVFGVELDGAEAAPATAAPSKETAGAVQTPRRKRLKKAQPADSPTRAPFQPTGEAVARLRRRLGLSKAAFARAVGVSAVTVANWENSRGAIQPHAKGLAGLRRLHKRSA